MKLKNWLEQTRRTCAGFSHENGMPASTIHRLITGERKPSYDMMIKIRDATGGEVQPNDFFDDLPASAAQ